MITFLVCVVFVNALVTASLLSTTWRQGELIHSLTISLDNHVVCAHPPVPDDDNDDPLLRESNDA